MVQCVCPTSAAAGFAMSLQLHARHAWYPNEFCLRKLLVQTKSVHGLLPVRPSFLLPKRVMLVDAPARTNMPHSGIPLPVCAGPMAVLPLQYKRNTYHPDFLQLCQKHHCTIIYFSSCWAGDGCTPSLGHPKLL